MSVFELDITMRKLDGSVERSKGRFLVGTKDWSLPGFRRSILLGLLELGNSMKKPKYRTKNKRRELIKWQYVTCAEDAHPTDGITVLPVSKPQKKDTAFRSMDRI